MQNYGVSRQGRYLVMYCGRYGWPYRLRRDMQQVRLLLSISWQRAQETRLAPYGELYQDKAGG